MSNKKMWLGVPGTHMQWVPCPLIDSTIQRNRYAERIQFDNGGGDGRRSSQYQMQYNFAFSGLAHEVDGIDAFNKFAQGFYGDGLIYLAHPANFATNLFAAGWASPSLIEQGWKNIATAKPTFTATPSNAFGLPARTATWAVTDAVGAYTKAFTLVIPPTHTLKLGVTGSTSGGGVVRIQPINADGSLAATQDMALLSTSSAARINTAFVGSAFQAIRVYITRSSDIASTVSVTSMMAQLYKTGTTPILPTAHYQGEGSTGLMFADEAIVETYLTMTPPRKGIATTLIEVEAWR